MPFFVCPHVIICYHFFVPISKSCDKVNVIIYCLCHVEFCAICRNCKDAGKLVPFPFPRPKKYLARKIFPSIPTNFSPPMLDILRLSDFFPPDNSLILFPATFPDFPEPGQIVSMHLTLLLIPLFTQLYIPVAENFLKITISSKKTMKLALIIN